MKLSEILKKDNNNIDLIRIIAAAMVIYGHAYEISPEQGHSDIVRDLIGFDYSGSLAVKIFFFISGLVVTNSLMNKRNVSDFILSRFFRIWPALMVVILISYIFSYIITSVGAEYFTENVPLFGYLISSFFLNFTWSFPGVFDGNVINVFNGSLWSIVYEVGCYIVLLSTVVLFRYNRHAINIICIVIIADSMYNCFNIFQEALSRGEVRYLPAIFALGVLSAVNKDMININKETVSLMIILSAVLYSQQSKLYVFSFYVSLMLALVYISSNAYFIKLKPKYDISYGIYLYGFPIQQIIYSLLGGSGYGIFANQISSILLSILAGLCSWLLIEKRFISYGRGVQKLLSENAARQI
ncbi:TPA: acyltransferase family protein [Escherichia albertii]